MLVNVGVDEFAEYLNGLVGRLHRKDRLMVLVEVFVVAQLVALLKTHRSVDTLRKVARSIRFQNLSTDIFLQII